MKYSIPFILSTTALFSQAALSQQEQSIERLTVTSDFRKADIQSISSSVSIVSADTIEQRQAAHLEDILNIGANINFASGASRGRFIQIRGIGERSQFAEPINPSVGFLIDNFDFSGVAGVGTLFDVEQVEILRGPQATEFGAAGMAGTIKIKTVEADADQPTRLYLSVGQQDTINLGAAYGNKITDKLFYRVALNQYKSDGFIENQFLGRDDTDNLDELTARLKLNYAFSDDAKFGLNYQYFDIDNGYDAFSLDNDGTTLSDEPGEDTQETHAIGLSANVSWHNVELETSLNHSTSDIVYGYDEDWTFTGFHPFGYTSTDYYFRTRDVTSLDTRLLSTDNSRIFADSTSWLLGLFARDSEEQLLREYTFADADFSSRYKPTNVGLYAQTDTQLSDSLTMTLGVRVDKFDINYNDSNGFVQDVNDTLVGGKAVLNYAFGTGTVYTSVSRGYKAGGFNPDERVSAEERLFEPEYNWNYEVGVKGYALDNTLSVRMALFFMDRKDTQVSDFDVIVRDDDTPDFIDIIGNADVGTNKGVEMELNWQATDSLEMFASYGYLDATFSDYQLADGTVVGQQRQAQAPKHTFHLAAHGYLNDAISIRVEADGKDEYRFSDGHQVTAPLTVLVNAQLRFDWHQWTFALWGKNIFDREHYVRGFGGFSNDPRDGYANPQAYYQLGDGRQFGLSASYFY